VIAVEFDTVVLLGTKSKALKHSWNKTLQFRGVFQRLPEVKAIESSFLERAMGIELYPEILSLSKQAVTSRSASQLLPNGESSSL